MPALASARDLVGRELRRSRARLDHLRLRLFEPEALVEAGRTPFEVIHRRAPMSLRYYPPLAESEIELATGERVTVAADTARTPVVLVPPLAVNMYVYDLFPQRSLVRYLRARGFEVYLIDWGEPGRAHDHLDLADYFDRLLGDALARVREHSGVEKLSLHGWSFGGLFALCHAALHGEGIANLVLLGAPADYHDNGALGERYRDFARAGRALRRATGLTARDLPHRMLRSPGWLNGFMFKATNPMASVRTYAELLAKLHDGEHLRSYMTNAAFLDNMVAYPGASVADIFDYLWIDNRVGWGGLPMAAPPATLAAVDQPILNITGRHDPIVTTTCSQAMLQYVESADVTTATIDGGHVGIVSGSSAVAQSWAMIADWLLARDGG